MRKSSPNIYNIPAGFCFAEALAQGLLELAEDDPLKLSEYLVLLPSRRACRTLRETFLRLSEGKALLLPRMQPAGDVDADDVSLLLAGDADAADILSLAPAIPALERQMLLAQAIQKTGTVQTFDQAASLARDLAHFLDEVQSEGLDFAALENLVPEEFAGHWQETLTFLKIITYHWPEILKTRGVSDPAARRNLLLEAQMRVFEKHPPQYPVIAAGTTGTIPVVRELLACVARLPQGAVVLPGLDTGLDDESWDKIGPDHPQYNMKTLLAGLGADRSDIKNWQVKKIPPANAARVRLLTETMRPAETTEQWRRLPPGDIPSAALKDFMRIDVATPQEEAEIIALIMRESLEEPGKTSALITPDRRLARRVTLALRRWGIQIDDSGGQPLTELPVGAFLMLTAEAAERKLAPASLLALLKHQETAIAMPSKELRQLVYTLDKVVLRGPRPPSGFAGLRQAVEKLDVEKQSRDRESLLQWLEHVEDVMSEFVAMLSIGAEKSFRELLQAHIHMAEALAATVDKPGAARLWQGEAGESAGDLLQDILAAAEHVPPLSPSSYVSILRMLLKSVTVRPRYGAHPRLAILGQIEARLFAADQVILGGLNEGTWPALPGHDPWLSRPMRKQFGLSSPENEVGLAAHDFVQAAAGHEIVLTRAQKVDGTPTVPARWLLRLEAVLQAVGLSIPVGDALRYRQWLKDMDAPAAITSVQRPAPTPPAAARPKKLSVTKVETWVRDPYQIYAQYVLGLHALDDIDADPGAAERGTFVHAALEKFIETFPKDLPANAEEKLLELGRAALDLMRVPPEVDAFWWPRFQRIARMFVEEERKWRLRATPLATEAAGAYQLDDFTLTGKADRIDKMPDGSYAIIDYKSGYPPTKTEVRKGISPQLPLEALMLQKGGFENIPAGSVEELVYWQVTGTGQLPVKRIELAADDYTAKQLAEEAEEGLRTLIELFRDEKTPYLSQPRADAKPKFSDYEHLARLREWGISGDDSTEDAA
jgi:ATP-dependent helicase/nuclease subunit B